MKQPRLMIDFSEDKKYPEADYRMKLTVRRAIEETLAYERFPYRARVSVTFCDNAYIHRLNRKYRGVDRPTDVLSFPMYDNADFDPAECQPYAELGDIVISLERAKAQAEEIGHSFPQEVAFLAVHSALHLLGYDHERSAEDEEDQCRRQREIVRRLGE